MTPSKASTTWNSTAGAASAACPRIAQRLLALTAAVWHNRSTGQAITRSLIPYDH